MNYEYILLKKENINLFKIPNITNTKGHYLENWSEKIFMGNLVVKAKLNQIWLSIVTYENKEYARTMPKDDFRKSVEKCVDSSRGFAILLEDGTGRSAWVGLVFHDRNDAFDFFATFDDFEKKETNKTNIFDEFTLDKDYSIKEGEKLNLGLGQNNFINDDNSTNNTLENKDFSNFEITLPDSNNNNTVYNNSPEVRNNNDINILDF